MFDGSFHCNSPYCATMPHLSTRSNAPTSDTNRSLLEILKCSPAIFRIFVVFHPDERGAGGAGARPPHPALCARRRQLLPEQRRPHRHRHAARRRIRDRAQLGAYRGTPRQGGKMILMFLLIAPITTLHYQGYAQTRVNLALYISKTRKVTYVKITKASVPFPGC